MYIFVALFATPAMGIFISGPQKSADIAHNYYIKNNR